MTTSDPDKRKRAEALYADQQWADADALFLELKRAGVHDGNLLHDHAVCIFQLGRKHEALQELDRALELEPDNPYRWSSRAWMRAALNNVDGAIEDYRKALALDPEDAIALNNLGLLEEQYGMRKSAQERFRKADTLMGILRDAGVDPAEPPSPSASPSAGPNSPKPRAASESTLWQEVAGVFTNRDRRRDFIAFVRNGFRA